MSLTTNDKLNLLVKSVTYETPDIRVYDLRLPDGAPLPSRTAGAHIDLHLSNGLIRSYSILNPESDAKRYVVGVARDRNSRGGSTHIHSKMAAGDFLVSSPPKNNFPLNEEAPDSVLIAGGIGITPMMSMISRLQDLGRNWQLYFATRSAELAPFREDLQSYPASVVLHCDDEHNGKVLDIGEIVANARPGSHFYCCGPKPMLESFERAVKGIPAEFIHVEHFSPVEKPATEGGFYVELSRLKQTVFIHEGNTILDTLLDAGIVVPYSCKAGVCGECQVKVISGLPDHRDLVLTEKEHNSNDAMMICCSGSKSEKLVLDL